jgi:hypothetical protein
MQDSVFIINAPPTAPFRHSFDFSDVTGADSILQQQPVMETGSFLQTGALRDMSRHTAQAPAQGDWIFWLILAGLVIFSVNKFQYEKRFSLLLSSTFSRSSAGQLMREYNLFGSQSVVYLILVFLISSVVLIHQAFMIYGEPADKTWQDILLYLQILGAYWAFLFFKFILILSAGFIFRNPDTAREYIKNIIIFNLIGGIVLLPLMLLIQYGSREIFIFFAYGIIALLLIIRFIRGFIIGLSDQKFSLYHLFLYLCTLEILPVLILAKFVDKYFFL